MDFHFLTPKDDDDQPLLVIAAQKDSTYDLSVPAQYSEEVTYYLSTIKFKARFKEYALIVAKDGRKILVAGLGKTEESTQDHLRRVLGFLYKSAVKLELTEELHFIYPSFLDTLALSISWEQLVTETCLLASYQFSKAQNNEIIHVQKIGIEPSKGGNLNDLKVGKILGESTCLARELINIPANELYPESLAAEAKRLSEEYGFTATVHDDLQCEKMGLKALMSVGRAALNKPRLIVLEWNGGEKDEAPIALLGKGVTYDTGGLSIKPTQSMTHMKSDMSGSAIALATMCSISRLKVKKNLVVVIAACENSIDGNAFRPGDIIGSYNGKTIEIGNTDAEGRLTLADAATYAIREKKAAKIIDIATLTGAVKVALGDHRAGVVTNQTELYNKLVASGVKADEFFWQLPIDDEYRDLNKSSVADIKNIGRDGLAGTIAAACFIEAFTEGLPWMHIDIAGTSFFRKDHEYISLGGSARGMRSLHYLIESLFDINL